MLAPSLSRIGIQTPTFPFVARSLRTKVSPHLRAPSRAASGPAPPPEELTNEIHPIKDPSISRAVIWTLVTSGIFFFAAVGQTNDDTRRIIEKTKDAPLLSTGWRRPPQVERQEEFNEEMRTRFQAIVPRTPSWARRYEVLLAEWWLNKSEAERTCWGIVAFNGVVFAAWHMRRFQPAMRRNWLHWPLSGRSYTLLTSTFSHERFGHFAFNSIALVSLGTSAHGYLAEQKRIKAGGGNCIPESTSRYHFLAFFAIGGIFAGLGSHCFALAARLPRLLRWRQYKPGEVLPIYPSLGSSGAIYSCLTLTALAYPEGSLSLIFLPFFPMSMGTAVTGLVALDIWGIVRGWLYFDHVAHLCGAAFGVVYYYAGGRLFDWHRNRFQQWQGKAAPRPVSA